MFCIICLYYKRIFTIDSSYFFPDKTILDVYETLMKTENMFVNYDYALITEDVGRSGEKMCHGIINVKSAQIQSKLDEYAPLVDAAVKNANGIASELAK